jgi:hypothetical protein
MKRILIFSTLALMAAACQIEPYSQDNDGEYLVYTSPSKDVNFAAYQTFDIVDSVLVIGQKPKPFYSQSDNALALIQAFRVNMEKLGYIYTPSHPDTQLGIQLTFVEQTERYVQYYDDPYWWLDYPGYWPSGYWGNWSGWYYPYPVTYTYTTNALITDMVDLTSVNPEGKLEIVWTSYIGGPASYSIQNDVARMKDSINQAFAQSPYLKPSGSR